MQALKKEVAIPDNHHLTLDFQLPDTIPAGKAEVMLIFQSLPSASRVQAKGIKSFSSINLSTQGFRFDRDEANER